MGLKETPYSLNYTAKTVKDERVKKQLASVSGLIPEMAIFSTLDDIPGIINAKIPKIPYGP